jgi:prepilin-type N-terminal cleavage/methylation domain-containing protein
LFENNNQLIIATVLRRIEMNKKGFTLIELLVTVAIIGILAAIAIPGYIGQQKRAARTEAYTNLENLRLLEEQYFAENGCYYRTGALPGVCTNATRTGNDQIRVNASGNSFLPRFLPGSSLQFDYAITTTGATATCFTATATGTSPRVVGDIFTIDCNNTRNF